MSFDIFVYPFYNSPITFDTNSDFVNYHPNTTYGNQGRALTKKEVVERMKTFITKHT